MCRDNFLMTFNLLIILVTIFSLSILGFIIVKGLLKSRKKTPESIYKLINNLEKKYIY